MTLTSPECNTPELGQTELHAPELVRDLEHTNVFAPELPERQPLEQEFIGRFWGDFGAISEHDSGTVNPCSELPSGTIGRYNIGTRKIKNLEVLIELRTTEREQNSQKKWKQ